MSKTGKASDLLAKMRKVSSSQAPLPEVDEPSIEALVKPEPEAPKPPERLHRITIDLEPRQYKFLKRYALEHDSTISQVIRETLAQMEGQ